MSNPDTASVWMFQDRGGNWKPFHDEQHRRLTIESGAWIVREFQPVPEAAAMAATVPASPHRPSPEWYATMIQSTADDDFQVGPAFVAAPKDHEIAALVNKLRDVAIEFHGAQQLRVRIAEIVVPALKAMQAPVAGQPAEPSPASRDAEDAERWRAFLACGRIRLIGTAGVNYSGIHDPNRLDAGGKPYGNHVHFGAEFWSTFRDQDWLAKNEPQERGRATLTEFADACRAALAAPKGDSNG